MGSKDEKKKIVYLNYTCYTDTDITVLGELAKHYIVIWYFIYETNKINKFSKTFAENYASKYDIILRVKDLSLRNRDIRNFYFYKKIINEINEFQPHVVFYGIRNPYWALSLRIYLKCGIPILGVHDVIPHSLKFNFSRLLDRLTNNLIFHMQKHFVTFSVNQHDLLLSSRKLESECVGMSYKYFGSSTVDMPKIEDGIKILFFGSINKYKGLDLLIQSIEKLNKNGIKKVSLTIAGKGDFWEICKKYICTPCMYNLNIRFIDNNEIPDLMSSHHFLALPYRDATQSGPLMIAVAYKLPIIAPKWGCFSDVYDNKSAILYENGDLDNALNKVCCLTHEEYDTIKNSCNEVNSKYTEKQIAANYCVYFDSVINNKC